MILNRIIVGACAMGGALTYSLAALRLNAALQLPQLHSKPVCHGFQNACVCVGCKRREKRGQAKARPRQPWEARKAA